MGEGEKSTDMKAKQGTLLYAVVATIVVTLALSIVIGRVCWFKQNEHVALWLEGIALVLIFVWDRLDRRNEHEETMAQIAIAKQQSQFALNAERAWLTVDLRWAEVGGRIIFNDSSMPKGIGSTTALAFAIEIRNDGRTPAWIEHISGGVGMAGSQEQPEKQLSENSVVLGTEKTARLDFPLICQGRPRMSESEQFHVHLTVYYQDIFEHREMRLTYNIDPLTYAIRKLSVETPAEFM